MPDVNFDTSVLVDYLRLRLDDILGVDRLGGDVRSPGETRQLLTDGDNRRVVGGKVDGEFGALCDRHQEIYDDLVEWVVENPDEPLVEYDVTTRDVQTSPNDVDFVRLNVQFQWNNDPEEKQASDFRRLNQEVQNIERELRQLLDRVYPQFDDQELAGALDNLSVDLGHDTAVVVDAAKIAKRDGIDLLVSTDSDTADEQEALNGCLDECDRSVELTIARPDEI